MPSSKNYVRDYKQEKKTADKRGETADATLRMRDRRLMEAKGLVSKGDGKEIDHKKAISKGGSAGTGSTKNLQVISKSKNRSMNCTHGTKKK